MQDEKEWFSGCVREYERIMYAVSKDILHNDEDVKDALQDAILHAYENLGQLGSKKKFKSWIVKITINASYDILRKRKPESDIEEWKEISAKEINHSERMDIRIAVEQLKEPYKQVITMFYFYDFKIKEISDITGDSVGAVKKQLQRAREQLKERLMEESVDENR